MRAFLRGLPTPACERARSLRELFRRSVERGLHSLACSCGLHPREHRIVFAAECAESVSSRPRKLIEFCHWNHGRLGSLVSGDQHDLSLYHPVQNVPHLVLHLGRIHPDGSFAPTPQRVHVRSVTFRLLQTNGSADTSTEQFLVERLLQVLYGPEF